MSVSIRDRLAVPRSIVATVRDREVTFLAAGISYYVLVSLVPLLTLAVVVAAVVGGADLATQVQSIAQRYLLPTGSELVASAITDPTGRGTLSVLSLLVTTWGALKLFRGIDVAFARIYEYPTSPIVEQLSDGLITLATLGGATIGVVITTAVMALVDVPFVGIVSPLVLLAFLVVAFLPLYAVIPDVPVGVRDALPGAVFAAVGWAVLSAGFGLYAQLSTGVAGALGAVLLLVTWFYFSGILVLTGAVLNAVLAGRGEDRDRQVQHPRDRRPERTMSADDETTDDDAVSGDAGPASDAREDPNGADSGAGDADDSSAADTDVDPRGAPDIDRLDRRVEELRADLDAFEEDVQSRTVERPDVESEMRRYVRGRLRRGKARGWGPYLVLLYGTAATIAAFYLLEDDLLAVVAMLVIYLSTLGLYALFVIFGVGLNALGVPGRLVDWVRDRRS
ncbi:YihY/virulence factor BrkB family protein [Halobellus limi]|uniref:YihY family inner membrane protein n=1 Tax=Halobellus limi TaxID=699433 RepID=A0A1H5W8V9_9EURY|nr:YihY/virulence factor BrkB family protein [Halobellus limi]QCC46508.1 YihY/virulence factor BrkB family protein [Halobellus limi]SEF95833.1 YihY family inner membrane protein [Halobellus limi]